MERWKITLGRVYQEFVHSLSISSGSTMDVAERRMQKQSKWQLKGEVGGYRTQSVSRIRWIGPVNHNEV